ncbi:hypothetical protein RCL1_001710 [Eukaryota sp. TZLM3-RCL]
MVNFESLPADRLVEICQTYHDIYGPLPQNRTPAQPYKGFTIKRIAFKLSYIGLKYHGMQTQPTSKRTIQDIITKAMKECGLLPESKEEIQWGCCGRTDSFVSAANQVIAVNIYSRLHTNMAEVGTKRRSTAEFSYIPMINARLPRDIRIHGYAYVADDWVPRKQCSERTYKYYVNTTGMDIGKMKSTGKKLIGLHDFRNFCKRDADVSSFVREIKQVSIDPLDLSDLTCPLVSSFHTVTITANSFLWNQIRYIIAVLSCVGSGEQPISVVDDLLDVENNPDKPFWLTPADPVGLVLADCEFDGLTWIEEGISKVQSDVSSDTAKAIRVALINSSILNAIQDKEVNR